MAQSIFQHVIVGVLEHGTKTATPVLHCAYPPPPSPTPAPNPASSARTALFEQATEGESTLPASHLLPLVSQATHKPLYIARKAVMPPPITEAAFLRACSLADAWEIDEMVDKAMNFAFPDVTKSGELGDANERTFSFCITEADGTRAFGICARVLGVLHDPTGLQAEFRMAPDGVDTLVVCVVSHLPWMSFFYQMVRVLSVLLLEKSPDVMMQFALSCSKLGFVPQGQTVSLPLPGGEEAGLCKLTRSVEDIDLLPLMSSLEPSHVIAAFASILFDRRVLVLSSNLERASLCVLALGDLLRPFRWHHIFIPVLPNKWIDYVMAPMPYICAMHTSNQPTLDKYPLDDVVIINLDTKSILFFEDDLDLIPHARFSKLIGVVSRAVASYHKCGVFDNVAVKLAFMRFFAHVMLGYRDYLDPVVDAGGDARKQGRSIDVDAFIASKKGKVRAFMEVFALSQHFEQFIKECDDPEHRDELFDSVCAAKEDHRKKLIRLPQFKSSRSLLRSDASTIDEDALAHAPAPEGAFQCTECERSYSFEADLAIHVMKRHRGSDNADGTFQCGSCERSYTTPEDLAFHMKKRHSAYAAGPSMRSSAGPAVLREAAGLAKSPVLSRTSLVSSPPRSQLSPPSRKSMFDTFRSMRKKTTVPTAAIQAAEEAEHEEHEEDEEEDDDEETVPIVDNEDVRHSMESAAKALGLAADDDVMQLIGGAGSRQSRLLTRGVTKKKLNLDAGQVLAATTTPANPLSKADKRKNRQSVMVQSNPNQLVLTVDVPAFAMQKKMMFNPEHKIGHIIAQITDTAVFQETRKRQRRESLVVAKVDYVLHVKKTVNELTKTIRMPNDAQLLQFELAEGDRIILHEVVATTKGPSGGSLLDVPTPFQASTPNISAESTLTRKSMLGTMRASAPAVIPEKKRPALPHKNATVLAQKFNPEYTQNDTVARASSMPIVETKPRSHYQSFDPVMRMPPIVKLRAVVGEDPDSGFVGVSLKRRDKIAVCREMVMAGCDILLPQGYDGADYALYKKRRDGSFVYLPLTVPLAAADFSDGDCIFVRPSGDDAPRRKAPTRATLMPPADDRKDTTGTTGSCDSRRTDTTGTTGSCDSRRTDTTGTTGSCDSRRTDTSGSDSLHLESDRKDSNSSTDSHGRPKLPSRDRSVRTATLPVTPRSDEEGSSVTKEGELSRGRICQRLTVENKTVAEVWATVGDFFDLAWTGAESCSELGPDEIARNNLVGVGGASAAVYARDDAQPPVGAVREFRHAGSTRAIRHRCLAYTPPAADLPSCSYAYEMVIEQQLVPRLPVVAYTSLLSIAEKDTAAVVEWTANLLVRDERIVSAVSDEYKRSLKTLGRRL